jgi:hypothetical protein
VTRRVKIFVDEKYILETFDVLVILPHMYSYLVDKAIRRPKDVLFNIDLGDWRHNIILLLSKCT